MHLTTALFLACACTVYAKESHFHIEVEKKTGSHPFRSLAADLEEAMKEISSNSSYATSKPLSIYETPGTTTQKPELESDSDEYSAHQMLSSPVPHDPDSWEPPEYSRSLKDYDQANLEVRRHLAYRSVNDKNLNYITILHVIDGLSLHVAQKGWESYNRNYIHLVMALVNSAKKNPQGAIDEIKCVTHAANRRIQGMRRLIKNKWVVFICRAKPESCDVIIHAVVKMSTDLELTEEADILLTLGQAGSNYLSYYSKEFSEAAKKHVLLYLLTRKQTLRKLVYKTSVARRRIFPNSDHCPVESTPYINKSVLTRELYRRPLKTRFRIKWLAANGYLDEAFLLANRSNQQNGTITDLKKIVK